MEKSDGIKIKSTTLKILDRYIGLRFFLTFLFIISLLIMISIVIDLTENLDNMIDHNAPAGPIIQYYVNFIPWIMSLLAPLFVFISVIFFTSRLTENSEIIAMISGGVNFYRLLLPYLVASLLIAGFFLFSNHYLLPRSNNAKIEFEDTWLGKGGKKNAGISNVHMQLSDGQIIYVRRFSSVKNTAHGVSLQRFEGNDVVNQITARTMEYVDSLAQWEMKDVLERTIQGDQENLIKTPKKLFTLDLVPNDFEFINNVDIVKGARETMTTKQLNKQIKRERSKGSNILQYFLIEKNKRTAIPVSIIIFTIMGVAISSRKVRGGIGIHLAFGLLLSAVYVLMLNFSETVSETTPIPARISIWLPNIIFAVITLILVLRAQK